MRNSLWIALVATALVSAAAGADDLTKPVGYLLNPDGTVQQSADAKVYPVATGKPQRCDDYYPSRDNPGEGETTLRFDITERGDVVWVYIARSSGNERLDRAAVNCISAWKFQPTLVNGAAARVRAVVRIAWLASMRSEPQPVQVLFAVQHRGDIPARPVGGPHKCFGEIPIDLPRAGIQGTAVVGFTISVEGAPKDVHIIRSSGNERLDRAAITCAGKWRYAPALRNGKVVEAPWQSDVELALH
jgi:TonB family protein